MACEGWRGAEAGGAQKGEEVQAGRRGDKRGQLAIEELLGVRRVRGRGRGLEVHVRWEGEDAAGTAERWADSWVGVTWLTVDMRKRARALETEQYGATPTAATAQRRWRRGSCDRGEGRQHRFRRRCKI